MSDISSLDILNFVAERDKAHKNQFSIDELAMAFPDNDLDLLLEKLFDLKRTGLIARISSWAYVPTQLGIDELAKI